MVGDVAPTTRTLISRGNGAGTSYAYDAASRLTSLAHDLAGASQDQSYAFTYNGAFQALTRNGSNAAYDWAPLANGTTASPANGLNQYASVGGAALTYDGRGNLTSDSSRAFAYDVYNRLTGVSGSAALTLAYDPAGRLRETIAGAATTRFLYDGLSIIAEYDGSGTLLRRHVHGPGVDEPLVSYDGAGTSNRAWLIADALGSVIASTNASAAATTINTYDEFGRPGAGNVGLFGFTGQMNLAAAGLMHYRARAYDPALGRFLQADPILFGGGMNLYAYVGNDPVNFIDPLGLQAATTPIDEIVVPGFRPGITDTHDIARFIARNDAYRNFRACDFLAYGCGDQYGADAYDLTEVQYVEGEDSATNAFQCGAGIATGVAAGGLIGGSLGALAGGAVTTGGGPYGTLGGAAAGGQAGTILGAIGGGVAGAQIACHGNSLSSTRPTWVYQVISNRDGGLLKYGITSRLDPQGRYASLIYRIGNARLVPIDVFPTRRQARDLELQLCNAYRASHGGALPPWSLVC